MKKLNCRLKRGIVKEAAVAFKRLSFVCLFGLFSCLVLTGCPQQGAQDPKTPPSEIGRYAIYEVKNPQEPSSESLVILLDTTKGTAQELRVFPQWDKDKDGFAMEGKYSRPGPIFGAIYWSNIPDSASVASEKVNKIRVEK